MDAFGYNEEENIICDVEEKISLEYFTGHLGSLNKSELRKGKALIFHPYPLGYNIGNFDLKNKDAIIKDVNIPISLVREHFQFENYFTNWSVDVLARIEKDFRRRKRLKKKKLITFVGIHNRRGDHIKDQVKKGVGELLPGYFLGGMDFYREKYKNVIFLYVSDDMEWGRFRLLPRVQTGDLFLAGALTDSSISGDVDLAAGYDLSLLSLCNHTILSYGTFSYWAGVLAGGYIFAPENYQNIEYFI
eukprot:TRINITY_DN12009_c0_g1_i1.p1 TRINITY_DN12009_c0_g1~~TRINITY_DN12009_c0_g1_i1.p1  ORF type:complete len:262 (+),score=54.03 TRINITY_DN12009_c0_g1_i1:50-787(+)